MKIRVLPLVVTVAVSAALLFGGWFAYRHFGVEQPLDRIATEAEGVQAVRSEMTSREVVLRLTLAPDADLAQVYRQVSLESKQTIGSRKLTIVPESQSSDKLEQAWMSALFQVAEAMEHRRYTDVSAAMDRLAQKYPGIEATAELDERNVYIRLRDGEAAKFVVLPRQPATLGVWPDA